MLRWRTHEHVIGAVTAVGARGTYSVQRLGPEWWLQGCGHDGLSLMQLGGGRAFAGLDSAQHFANELDRMVAVESMVSGA